MKFDIVVRDSASYEFDTKDISIEKAKEKALEWFSERKAEIHVIEEKRGHIHCPVNGWDCPYFDANGCCMMYPDSDPLKECDDFAVFWDEEDDYICYETH